MPTTPGRPLARLLGFSLIATLAFRLWLGAALPMTGDEAYFIWWGWRPDWGFYDHPPMVGWWLAALSLVSDAPAWLRLPSILQPAFLSLAVRWALPRLWPELAAPENTWRTDAIALLLLLAPANVWNVLITTDTPLVYFSVLSALAWVRAAQERDGDDLRWYLASGIFLTGAVLSKYFVALLGFAYLIDVLRRRSRIAFAGLALSYACCLPALALMAWWNSGHCWPNYMFNFVNRNASAGASALTPLLYAASLLYLLTPPALWLAANVLVKRRSVATDFQRPPAALGSLALLAAVPLALFALLSIPKTIGLHWLLTFVPLVLIWLGMHLPARTLTRLSHFFIGFALLHVLVIAVMVRMPLETWKNSSLYSGLVLTADAAALGDALAHDRADTGKRWLLATDGYSSAATLGYNLREEVIVFGEGSLHARQDDINTDFRALDGRNILILRKSEPVPGAYDPYFATVSTDRFEVHGAEFWRVRGEGFRFAAYRDRILRSIQQKYYRLPAWLPQTGCYFCDRYFPGEVCHR